MGAPAAASSPSRSVNEIDNGRTSFPNVHDENPYAIMTLTNPFRQTSRALWLLTVNAVLVVWGRASSASTPTSSSSALLRDDVSRWQGRRRGPIVESARKMVQVRGDRSTHCFRLDETEEDPTVTTNDDEVDTYYGSLEESRWVRDDESLELHLLAPPSRRRRFSILECRSRNHHRAALLAGDRRSVSFASSTSSSSASFQDASRPVRPSMWPPWPFSLLQPRGASSAETNAGSSPTPQAQQGLGPAASLLWPFLRQSAHAGLLNLQYMTSQLLFHLPPASPPLLVLACIPQHRKVLEATGIAAASTVEASARTWIVPLTSDPFVRTIALSCLGLAVLSWAHSQVHRLNAMTPLPLAPEFQDVYRAVLPPFLPDEERAHHRYLDAAASLLGDDDNDDDGSEGEGVPQGETEIEEALTPSLQSLLQWNPFGDSASTRNRWRPGGGQLRGALRAWRQDREARLVDRRNAHRIAVMDQLLALQSLKRKSEARKTGMKRKSRGDNNRSGSLSAEDGAGRGLGYGVVTGASRGIGRAIAVELARFGIPLVLVARDLDRLTSLAYDLQACYGVDCCVLQADLTQPHAAAAIYRSIQEAGLTVDILVNNAGLSSHGLSVDMPMQKVDNMLSVNVHAVTTLAHLFGKDMKERRRGRILMVSSVNGAVSGIPSVSVYTATKAFERTLATSLGREMEPCGVGVTCLLPGAVRDTDFRSRSDAHDALCWKIPFYLKTPAQVAEMGVRALLLGQPEVTPGWMNRVFLKFLQPVVPARMHSLVAEVMWNPLRMPWHRTPEPDEEKVQRPALDSTPVASSDDPHSRSTRLRYKIDSAPRLLTLEDCSQSSEESPSVNGTAPEGPGLAEPTPTDVQVTAPTPEHDAADGHSTSMEPPSAAIGIQGSEKATPSVSNGPAK